MKHSMVALVSLGLLVASALAQQPATAPAPKADDSGLKDSRQKASYGIGLLTGKNLMSQAPNLDTNLFVQGLKDAYAKKPALLTDDQIKDALVAYQQEMVALKAKEGETFLAENKKKEGVTTLPSGLQYKVLKQGTGKSPKATDTVSVNYEGRLIDNTVFDSSAKQGAPVSFPVNGVIKGFSEALQLMKVGSKWQVYLPSNLAYGASPPPGSQIGPNSPLIFDLELVEVKEGSQ
jgi:FKBP-type peptidyl-prolyl cis-trans isomerase FklB